MHAFCHRSILFLKDASTVKATPLSPEELLRSLAWMGNAQGVRPEPSVVFQRLNGMEEGVALFAATGERLYTNPALSRELRLPGGSVLYQDVEHFATSLAGLVVLRGLGGRGAVEELEVRRLRVQSGICWLRGSYIGHSVFGVGRRILIVLTPPADQRAPVRTSGHESLLSALGLIPGFVPRRS